MLTLIINYYNEHIFQPLLYLLYNRLRIKYPFKVRGAIITKRRTHTHTNTHTHTHTHIRKHTLKINDRYKRIDPWFACVKDLLYFLF